MGITPPTSLQGSTILYHQFININNHNNSHHNFLNIIPIIQLAINPYRSSHSRSRMFITNRKMAVRRYSSNYIHTDPILRWKQIMSDWSNPPLPQIRASVDIPIVLIGRLQLYL